MNYRKERIELEELRYELTRGVMEREIDESMGYQFMIPMSASIPNGLVRCEFRMRPLPHYRLNELSVVS